MLSKITAKIKKSKNRILLCALYASLTAAAVITIAVLCSVKVNLTLYIDGAEIGTVEDASEVDAVRARVIEDVSKVAYGQSFSACNITYGFAEGKKECPLIKDFFATLAEAVDYAEGVTERRYK